MTDDEKRRWKGPSDKRGTSGRRMGERKIIAHRAKNESSKRWIERQLQDPYVQKARSEGYRARAAYKLLEIEEKLHLFRRGSLLPLLRVAQFKHALVPAAARVGAG